MRRTFADTTGTAAPKSRIVSRCSSGQQYRFIGAGGEVAPTDSPLEEDRAAPLYNTTWRETLQAQLVDENPAGFHAPWCCPQIRPKSFVTLPEALARERDRVECMTFMGLLPEIDHAWMTVDNVLYLWNYHTQDFTQFRDLEQARPTSWISPGVVLIPRRV